MKEKIPGSPQERAWRQGYIMTSSNDNALSCAVQCLTCDFDDLCEDVIGHLLSILNGTDPL